MKNQKFKNLPLGKKLQYLAEKYTWHVVLAVFLITAIGNLVYKDLIAEKPLMRVEMIDAIQQSPDGEAFDPFLRDCGYDQEDRKVEVSKIIQVGQETTDMKCSLECIIGCSMQIGETDLYFWNPHAVDQDAVNFTLMDLRMVLPQEVLEQHKDQLVYTGPILDGGYPCGIRLTDNAWIRENNYYGDDCVVGISRTAADKDMVSAFIEYIL